MSRTFLICIGPVALIAAVMTGALARAGGGSPGAAPTNVKVNAHADAVNSASKPRVALDEDASADNGISGDKGASATKRSPTGSNAQKDNAKSKKTGSDPTGAVKLSGESVVGNQNAPKSLVLVPWKSAEIGKMPGLSMLLDDSVRPVDKDVFMRELAYYRIRVGAK